MGRLDALAAVQRPYVDMLLTNGLLFGAGQRLGGIGCAKSCR